MCGVIAAAALHGGARAPDLGPALRALAHRGPDGSGAWTSADARVALGHARLAVRDLDGGAQPLGNEDGTVMAVVNGELYGARALRHELLGRGHLFRARTDSELVVHAWEEWGPGMLARLRGELAFVLWDARDRTLFAARDRFGVKPLAWCERGGVLLVASQIRALFALGLRPAWDEDALDQCASFQYAPRGATLFRGARELPAGHSMVVKDGRVAIREYADIDAPREPRATFDERDAARHLGSLLDDAVRERLDADVPCAFQLSGGLDSGAVLASAAHLAARPLDAFTVSFAGGGAYDEGTRAEAIARHLGARLHVVRVTDADVAESFADAVVHAEGACINAHAAAKLRLSAALRASGFKVVLTGEGADEVLFGYAHLRGDLEGGASRVAATNGASSGLMLPDGEGLSTDAVRDALGFVPTWIAAKATFGRRVRAIARDEWRARTAHRDAGRALLDGIDVAGRLAGRGRVEQAAYLWSKLALEGYILRALGDGLEMANGVEGRLPFLDAPLVDFARALPTHAKIRGGVEKWILREAARARLPAEVIAREKHPFLAPPVGARTLAVARDVFGSASFRGQPLLDPARAVALVDALPAMTPEERKAHDPVVLFALSIGVLHARFGVAS